MNSRAFKFYLSAILAIGLANFSNAQLLINEVASASDTAFIDEDNDQEDWIELYNSGNNSINLLNYSLSAGTGGNIKTWTFPNVVIQPKSFLTVFCSEKNRNTWFDHWEVPVYYQFPWKYFVGSIAPPPNWKSPSFNDNAWPSGIGGIGYGDNDDSTKISPTISLFMRQSFLLPDTSVIAIGALLIDYDDAFVAYLNGIEIARSNIGVQGDNPSFNTFAYDEHEASIYQFGNFTEIFFINEKLMDSAIVQGINTFSIQVHNYNNGMDDLSSIPILLTGVKDTSVTHYPFPADIKLHTNFKLDSKLDYITLKNPNNSVVDTQNISQIKMNHSRGRLPDGSGNWCLFNKPSPGKSNNFSYCFSDYSQSPSIVLNSGFYTGTQYTSIINNEPNSIVRYTLNGDNPTQASTIYTVPVKIDSTSVIRAASFSNNSLILTGYDAVNTYFINENTSLPVISLVSDNKNLFDWNYGIYMLGPNANTTQLPYHGANFWQNWERDAYVEYFDKEKKLQFELFAGIEIQGNYSKAWPQKGFTVKAKDNYGGKDIRYTLFSDKPNVNRFKSFNIRNAGSDWNTCHFRDRLNHQQIHRKTNVDVMAGKGCLLFINGSYFGVYEIRERQDENYIAFNHNIDPENVDFLKFDGAVIKGSNKSFFDMVTFISKNNMAISANYDSAQKMLDITNFADYFITETYIINIDWLGSYTNNIKFWRTNNPAGKWRYIFWDTDLSLGFAPSFGGADTVNHLYNTIFPQTANPHSSMLSSLLKNIEFRNYFVNRYADLMNTQFRPYKFNASVDEIYNELVPEMQRHFKKWGGTSPWPQLIGSSYDIPSWQVNITKMKQFITNRIVHSRNQIENVFNLNKQVQLSFTTLPKNAGTIALNTILLDSFPWNGIYFDGVPVTFSAVANPGFKFKHWTSANLISTPNTNSSITINPGKNDDLIAVFERMELDINVTPNPFSDIITVACEINEERQITLQIYDVLGKLIYNVVPENSFIQEGSHQFTINTDALGINSGMYFLTLRSGEFSRTIKIIKNGI